MADTLEEKREAARGDIGNKKESYIMHRVDEEEDKREDCIGRVVVTAAVTWCCIYSYTPSASPTSTALAAQLARISNAEH